MAVFKTRAFIFLYLALLAVALTVMAVLFLRMKPLPPRDFEQIRNEGVLHVVAEYNQTEYYLSDDSIEGFQYELCREISNISGLEIYVYLEMSLSECFNGLTGQKYDIVARNIPATSEMKAKYLFSKPVVLNKQVLVQRAASAEDTVKPIRNQLDLAGKTLYVPENSSVLLRLNNLQHEIGDSIRIVEYPCYSSEQLIMMVAGNEIDYAVCDQQIAKTLKKQIPGIDIDTDISFTQLQSWAVRKDSPVLLDSLNTWLDSIKAAGTFEKIYRKYYYK